jgi:UDP:flavonoid glycosyltransferase YjiC (YdhE family)
VVTQRGIGTVMKALRHGVPLVCLPLTGDQPDNAARVVARGAGVRLPGDAEPERISSAIQQVLGDQGLRTGARRLAKILAPKTAPRTRLASSSTSHADYKNGVKSCGRRQPMLVLTRLHPRR